MEDKVHKDLLKSFNTLWNAMNGSWAVEANENTITFNRKFIEEGVIVYDFILIAKDHPIFCSRTAYYEGLSNFHCQAYDENWFNNLSDVQGVAKTVGINFNN